jgi:hypothetical protein
VCTTHECVTVTVYSYQLQVYRYTELQEATGYGGTQ